MTALYRTGFLSLLRAMNPPPNLYRHLAFSGDFRVEAEGSCFTMRHYGYEVENDVYWRGLERSLEGQSLKLWAHFAKQSLYIADVGANTGVYALAAAAVNPAAKVIAIEPVARVFGKLAQNVALNSFEIMLVEAAVSDANGTAELFDMPADHVYSASLDANQLGEAASVRSEVRTVRLDDLFRSSGFERIDLVKLDVERYEPQALRGMPDFLAYKPTMLIEILDERIGADIAALVDGLGYHVYAIDEKSGPTPAPAAWQKQGENRNYLFTAEPL